jgi:transposase-like protein
MKKEEKKLVLEAYRKHNANIAKACEEVGISREIFYQWSKQKSFSEKLQKIKDSLLQELESLAFSRSFEGSDTLLKFLLAKLHPDKYGDKLEVKYNKETLDAMLKCLPNDSRERVCAELKRQLSD